MPQQLSLKEFGAQIKAKYPQYAQFEDEDIGQRMLSKYPQYQDRVTVGQFGNVQSGASTTAYTPPGPTAGDVAKEQAMTALGGIPKAITQIPGAVMGAGSLIKTALTGTMPERAEAGMQALQGMGQMAQPFITATKGGYELAVGALPENIQAPVRANAELMFPGTGINAAPPPGSPEWTQAAEGGGQMLGSSLLGLGAQKGIGAIRNMPSMEKAGTKFSQVMEKAKDVPLDLSKADDVALRALEMGGRGAKTPGTGSSLPKVFADYIRQREASPVMTYQTGRDFAVNAGRLSAAETQAANPVMQRQVALLAKALKEANREAAAQVGMGGVYDQAMKEFAKAAGRAETKAALIELLKQRGPQAAIGGGAAYGLYRALTE